MARFFSREEWPLVVAGILAGLLTSIVVLYFFFTGIGGHAPMADETLLQDQDAVADAARRAAQTANRAPIVGAHQAAIVRRLDAVPVSAAPLRGPLTVTVRNLVWNEQSGAQFARVDVATARLELNGVARGDVRLDNVVMHRPVIALREERAGWNFERVFAELLESDADGPTRPVRRIEVRGVRIENGAVEVTRPNQRFALRAVQGRLAQVVFSGPGVTAPFVRAAELDAQLVRPDVDGTTSVALADGLFSFPRGAVRFDIAAVTLDRTRLADLDGMWHPADPGYGVTASGRAIAVDFADMRNFAPERFPGEGTASFHWRVRPLAPDLTVVALTDLAATSGNSRVTGALTVHVGPALVELRGADLLLDPLQLALVENFLGRPLPYRGAIAGRVRGTDGNIAFDVVANLTAPDASTPFRAELTGAVRMLAGGAFALQAIDANLTRVPLAALKALAPGLPLDGFVTGRVSLSGPPGEAPLAVNVRLELGNGVAIVEGAVDLTGAVPSYDLAGRLVGVNLQSIIEPRVPPVDLTARFVLRGSGTDPATMNAHVRVDGRFTGWQTRSDDTVLLVAAIRAGTLDVDTLNARLVNATVVAAGEWRFTEPQSGAVTYAVNVPDMAPFGPYLPMLGDSVAAGSLRANGTIAGTLSRMTLAGVAEGTELRFGGWQATELEAEYEVTTGGGRLPVARIEAEGRGIGTPTAGSYAAGTISMQLTPPALAFNVTATRAEGGLIQVVATGDLPETGPRSVFVQQARFDLADGTWTLVQPATIQWTEAGTLSIRGLELAAEGGVGRMFVDGVIRPFGQVDMQLRVAALPVGDVQRFLGLPARLEGTLWAEGAIRGGTENPLVDVDFRIEDGSVADVPLRRAEGQLAYQDNITAINAQIVVDTAGTLEVNVRLPSRLSLGDGRGFALIDGASMTGSIVAQQFALAPLTAVIPRVQAVTGTVDARVDLSGTPDAPVIAGAFSLAGGAVTVPELNQRYTEITGRLSFDGRRLIVEDMRARSDGWATVGGVVVFERLDEPVMNLTVTFDGFRPIGVEDQGDAALFGTVAITGPLAAMDVTGDVRAEDGYFVLPQFGPAGVRTPLADMTQPASVIGREIGAPTQTNWLRNLSVRNLRVTIGEGTWFQTAEARIQLAGELTIGKIGETTPITGVLTGTRGQYTLVAGPLVRRFQIVSAQLRFLGNATPDPHIDIVARRTVIDPSARQVDVDVRIAGTLSRPTLAIAGGEGAPVAESELLSFLLFGQSTASFAGDVLPGDQLLGQTFLGGLAELGALELERSLGGLGLDIFEIRLGQGNFGGLGAPTFVFGRQLDDKVFLTVETGIAALLGEGSSAPLTGWAVRLDWAIDRRARVRLAWEPVYRGRSLRSSGLALPFNDPKQQLLVEYRRRWNY
ncbi:MAG TPA: translocation/assembly module TamB domain-containing protein [Longimicrobiales bacterium]|nr:translocation/assembly module TamB domain-containing protein [Longimicrobiales bacterium]